MPLTVVVGGQYGGEGKGKIVSHLSVVDDVDYVVRCGGPNSGHTVDYKGFRIGLRSLPSGFINKKTKLMIATGGLLDPRILFDEIQRCGVSYSRIIIDRNTCVVKEEYRENELERGLRSRIGSTASGTGVAVAKRALRDSDVKLAKDVGVLRPFIGDVSGVLNQALDEGKSVVVEGTQGFGLSVYHAECYPYATSRDTTASGFLSEVGLSPRLVTDVIMAVRTFPIRVEGESGPLSNEFSWAELQKESGYPYPIEERTTATNRTRRVARFDPNLVQKAVKVNRPTLLAIHGLDYLGYENKGISEVNLLSQRAASFIGELERVLGVPVFLMGTGPTNEEIVDRRNKPNWQIQAKKVEKPKRR